MNEGSNIALPDSTAVAISEMYHHLCSSTDYCQVIVMPALTSWQKYIPLKTQKASRRLQNSDYTIR